MEPSVLVLGIISSEEGAIEAIKPHLGGLVPYLMELTSNSSYAVLKSTTLWTLS